MHKAIQELLFDTFIKNPIWGILIPIFGFTQFNSGIPERQPGVIFGVGIAMVAVSIWHHYSVWKQKRKHPIDSQEE